MSATAEERVDERNAESHAPTEQTPLLGTADEDVEARNQSRPQNERAASSVLFSNLVSGGGKSARRRWPSLLALLLLCIVAVLIMVFAFLAPSVVEQYAQQAVTFEPTSLSIAGFSSSGVRAKVQGDFSMNASKVESKSVRDLGRFGTWIASKAESGETTVEVSLPEYGNVVLGTAHVPPIVVGLRDGKVTPVEFYTDLKPGDIEGIRRIASDWIDGRLGQLRVLGKADIPIKSGIFSFGTQQVTHELVFANKDVPKMPAYKIKKLNIHEVNTDSGKGMAADVSLQIENPYPVDFTVPPMSFDILVSGCQPSDPNIMIADALTHVVQIHPNADVELNVTGTVREIPDVLTQACPGSKDTPLDQLLGGYIHGKKTKVYVTGSDRSTSDTPDWVKEILSSVTVPIDVPGRGLGHMIKNFSMTDTHFTLPGMFAQPGTPDADPKISATVQAIISLPEEMNFNISADEVRANATVYYKKKQLGTIDMKKQPAKTMRLPADEDGPSMLVETKVKDVPIHITDDDVFTDILTELLVGSHDVMATLKADVDVGIDTALGHFEVKHIPTEGEVPLKPILSGHGSHNSTPDDMIKSLDPQIYDISIVSSTPSTLTISALVNITNPTIYTADIPYLSLHALTNGSVLANVSVEHISIGRGNNSALEAVATWNPSGLGGEGALDAGVSFLSQFISGYNTSLTFKPHNGSIPALPSLSNALSRFNITVPTPKLPDSSHDPADGTGGPKFITEAKFHLFSSSADFVLRSPLPYDTLTITHINATALYKDSRIGQIVYDEPFDVLPIDEQGDGSLTPRLPVDWDTGSVGWDAVRRALGGRLRIAAEAIVDIAVGKWSLKGVCFKGHGLGVGVRP